MGRVITFCLMNTIRAGSRISRPLDVALTICQCGPRFSGSISFFLNESTFLADLGSFGRVHSAEFIRPSSLGRVHSAEFTMPSSFGRVHSRAPGGSHPSGGPHLAGCASFQ